MNRKEIGEALQRQEGGDHYRTYEIQPVEYIVANQIGFLAGNVIKYATRYRDKNGAEDIKKAIHYLELILEFEYGSKSEKSQKDLPVCNRLHDPSAPDHIPCMGCGHRNGLHRVYPSREYQHADYCRTMYGGEFCTCSPLGVPSTKEG